MVTASARAAPPPVTSVTPAADDASARFLGFIDSVAAPVQQPLMCTPTAKKKKKVALPLASPRRSGRLANKKRARSLADGAEAIQELIARVCGILAPTATFDDAAKAAYQQLFINAPLAASAIHALEALVKQKNVNIFNWNPRGLNSKVRRDAVRDLIRDTHASIVCLQETKLDVVDDAIISATLGPNFIANYAFLPAIGTSGGMILSVSDAFFTLSDVHVSANTLSASITMLSEGTSWSITCVYGPQSESDKLLFIEELKGLKSIIQDAWLLLGDFNLITKASDKNNLNINRRLIGKFRAARDFLVLKDMRMDGRRFTWSNAQADPVLTKIDHVFCTTDWDALFLDAYLQAITSACSDHVPLLLQGSVSSPRKHSFKFEEFWFRMQGFKETVTDAWNKDILATDPIRRVHIKLARTAKALKRWQRQSIGDLRMQLATAKEIILRMDQAEEARPLSDEERALRRQLKCSYLGLLSIQKIKLRQRSRLTWIRLGDANTKFFHTEIFPVRCADIDLVDILADFPAKLASFPGKYLGLPLHFRRLWKVDLQPLIDKIAGKLPGWIGKNLARPGRVILAKTVLMATGIYHATIILLPKWARDRINKIARTFVWVGEEGEHAA
ncbi:hypothetical protein ACQ4PT_071319 [Festuca glaucescens]